MSREGCASRLCVRQQPTFNAKWHLQLGGADKQRVLQQLVLVLALLFAVLGCMCLSDSSPAGCGLLDCTMSHEGCASRLRVRKQSTFQAKWHLQLWGC